MSEVFIERNKERNIKSRQVFYEMVEKYTSLVITVHSE